MATAPVREAGGAVAATAEKAVSLAEVATATAVAAVAAVVTAIAAETGLTVVLVELGAGRAIQEVVKWDVGL